MNIDDYRKLGNPRRNGLGFVWIMNGEDRYNFYHPELLPIGVQQYHNHRYSFVSTILKGKFCNRRAELVEGNKELWAIDCVGEQSKLKGGESVKLDNGVDIFEGEVEYLNEGDSYYMNQNEYHIAWAETPAITHLEQMGEPIQGLGVYHRYDYHHCPIADFKLPHHLCWEIIEEIINHDQVC
tara:strand:- start:77 stop:622 length:546 start_codon:yes stop_codon:yes gene_type:complete